MTEECNNPKPADGLYRAIIGTAIAFAILLAALLVRGGPGPIVAVLPWFIPMISLFQGLVLFSVAFLALERYNVLRNTAPFWIGLGAAGFGVALGFYALTWPDLMPGGGSIIASLPGTPAWFLQFGITIFSTFLLASVLVRRPVKKDPAGWRLLWVATAWMMFLMVVFTVVLRNEQHLPVLVTPAGVFTAPILIWNALTAIVFAVGAVLSTRRYRQTGDALLGYIAFAQTGYAFAILATVSGMRRYDLWWYLLRLIVTGNALIVLFGLLSEYVQLFRRERERATEVLRAEAALRRSEDSLKKAQEIAHLGSWELDLISNRLSWSDEVYRIFGLQPQEFAVTYEAFLDHVHPDDRESVDAAYSGSIRENRDTYEIEHRVVRRPDGEVRVIHEKCEHIRDESGRIFRSIGMVHDITERRKTEEELRESEERFRTLVTASSEVLYHMSPDWSEMRQLSSRGFLANTEKPNRNWLQEYIHPDDQPRVTAVINEAIRTKSVFELEHRVRRADGSLGWTFSRAVPLLDSQGEIVEWFGTAIDITERKRAEEDLKKRTTELEYANKELESFSYSVSHDLRAPLRAIEGFSRMLLRGEERKLDPRTKRVIHTIQESAQKMDRLINDLLNLSRSGRTAISRSTIDMNRLAQEIWKEQIAANPDRDTELVKKYLPTAVGDRNLIRQVFTNLLSNAVKFTKRREKAVIEIGGETKGTENIYYVKDNGAGFDMKYYDKLFGVFQRLHSQGEYEGTGVGLAIVQRIIHRHGGRVWAEGEVDKGATFYFSLPNTDPRL